MEGCFGGSLPPPPPPKKKKIGYFPPKYYPVFMRIMIFNRVLPPPPPPTKKSENLWQEALYVELDPFRIQLFIKCLTMNKL